ncbi:MAG TPA: DinB family protein [Daejeonella sp.]|nr:DinB family protein [Daejeonella sp.]
MQLTKSFLSEMQHEAENTRKMLERVPSESLSWKPHEKSMALGRLAAHVAELYTWVKMTLTTDELDFATAKYTPPVVENTADIVKLFNDSFNQAVQAFEDVKNEELYFVNWKLRQGDYIILDLPKHIVLRSMVFNHIVHHRAQLSVYLRLLNVPVPGMYGPSADEM